MAIDRVCGICTVKVFAKLKYRTAAGIIILKKTYIKTINIKI